MLNSIETVDLISGVDFTNIVHAAFMLTDPKSAKKTNSLTVFFALLGSARIKTYRKMLEKLTPGVFVTSLKEDHKYENPRKTNVICWVKNSVSY